MTRNLVRTFLIGASVSIFPAIYLSASYNKLTCEQTKAMKIKYATLLIILPLMYGLVYTVLSVALEKVVKQPLLRLFVIGAIAGEIYSLVGHFGLRIPETLLLTKNPNVVHIVAPVVYSVIYGTYVYFLEKNV